jgi:hypothetical protein
MKFTGRINIQKVDNGFIISPDSDKGSYIELDKVKVAKTYNELLEEIKEYFEPKNKDPFD